MTVELSRRSAIGVGALSALSVAATVARSERPAGAAETEGADNRRTSIGRAYRRATAAIGGDWRAHIALVNPAGRLDTLVDDDADRVTHAYSVQKLAVATAVMDKIDRAEVSLGQKLDLPADLILGGSGIYHLHTVWGDEITVANVLTAMLLMSDNTAVRMCGRLVPALEINEILAAKGFTHTRVEPVANPNRFFLGTTTAREMHDLLWRLANQTLLSPASCEFLLHITRWVNGYHDGIRRNMSSNERSRVATKYGAAHNETGAARHEAGVMFSVDGAPALTYALFADGLSDPDNYGATHPAVQAHAHLGRVMLDTVAAAANPPAATRAPAVRFQPVDGG